MGRHRHWVCRCRGEECDLRQFLRWAGQPARSVPAGSGYSGFAMNPALPEIPPQWAWHHRTLLCLRTELLRARQEHDSAARRPHERGGADLVDIADDEVELTTLLGELAIEESELNEIDAALQRLADGTYGVCEATGEAIAPERLRVLPWTRYSVAEAARRELAAGGPRARGRAAGR